MAPLSQLCHVGWAAGDPLNSLTISHMAFTVQGIGLKCGIFQSVHFQENVFLCYKFSCRQQTSYCVPKTSFNNLKAAMTCFFQQGDL